ncbi:leucine-rich repeat domain-containing protein [Acinetobacter calcoaceticus]|uniref:leucine-rich repeat domain-containing protein n=1 Tax=Acinetobacter calcoaceticus TaxID=471 RepID=UPI003F7C3864
MSSSWTLPLFVKQIIEQKDICLPEGITEIRAPFFFNWSRAQSLEIPEGVTLIGDYAFQNWSAGTSIKLPNSLLRIENSAFQGWDSLKTIVIPENVVFLGDSAFGQYTKLTEITVLASTPPVLEQIHYPPFNFDAVIVVKVPAASVDLYKAAPIWSTVTDKIVAI